MTEFALGPWRVHRVGLGAMQLAGEEDPPVLRAAVDDGVNHIDTAQFYGAGVVNELIRQALHPYPSDVAIVSKVAARPDTAGATLRQGIEENLATLGTSRLAAVNLRVMDPSAAPDWRFDAQLVALINAREEGLIGGIGLSKCFPAAIPPRCRRNRDRLRAEPLQRGGSAVIRRPRGMHAAEHRVRAVLPARMAAKSTPGEPGARRDRGQAFGDTSTNRCSTSRRTSCSFREPAPPLTSPRTSTPPTSRSTTRPARS